MLSYYMTEVTFVTAFILLESTVPGRTLEWRMSFFDTLVNTGIKICVYGDSKTLPILEEYALTHKNIKVMPLDYKETPIYKMCADPDLTLPNRRTPEKDTRDYMQLINSKISFVNDAIQKNPWNSEVFAWIDFSIAYIFKDFAKTLDVIKKMGATQFVDKFMTLPGCWSVPNGKEPYVDDVCWRFCGGFFIGDKTSLTEFYNLHIQHLPEFFTKYKKLVWEAGIWAWIEANHNWNPLWYYAAHDDGMLNVPQCVVKS